MSGPWACHVCRRYTAVLISVRLPGAFLLTYDRCPDCYARGR